MRTVFWKKLFAILVLFSVAYLPLRAQMMHYVGLSGRLGYSAMFDNITLLKDDGYNDDRNQVIGGVGAGLGFLYELQVTQFRFHTGLEFDFMNAATRIGDFSAYRSLTTPSYPTMQFRYDYTQMRETRNVGYLSLPLMFGAYFNRYYFFVGPKVGINLMASYSMKSDVAIRAKDKELIGDLENMPNHGLETHEWDLEATPLELGLLNVSVAGEFGVNLDEWLAPKPKRRRGRRGRPQPKTFKESLHYRAGIYAEYGVLNINNFSANNLANLEGNLSGNALPAYATGSGVADMAMATQLGTAGAEKASLNPFFVGAKFTILYEIPKKYKKPQPRPKPRPKPQPKPKATPPLPPPPHLAGVLVDAETQQRLADVQVVLYDAEDNVVFEGVTSSGGVFGTVLGAGTYGGYFSKQGYLPYDGDIVFKEDSVFITMTALKEKEKIVISNLFFATAKTTILPESEPALEELYYLLVDNPDLRIKIIGHTDNVGSDASNLKLSEGRAKSVRNNIIMRGIDPSRIEYEGRGESEPIDTNDTEEGRSKNRRVEFEILSSEKTE